MSANNKSLKRTKLLTNQSSPDGRHSINKKAPMVSFLSPSHVPLRADGLWLIDSSPIHDTLYAELMLTLSIKANLSLVCG